MADYRVTWNIEVEADSHEEAAEIALQIQRDSTSRATIFDVVKRGEKLSKRIDLGYDPRLDSAD